MVNHLDRARRELSLPCRLLMDIAGPKLRTGSVEPGPGWSCGTQDAIALEQVKEPARIWLAPAERSCPIPAEMDATLPVPAEWLSEVRPGERIHFEDARAKRRVLEVVGGATKGDGLDAARPHTLLRERC